MSTLRISNIEAKSVPASATIDEKVKITNSSGDVLVFLDGKTSGITTVGINTTDGNITFDANSNVVVTGIITATKFVGTIEPTNLTVGGDLTIPDKIIHTGDTNTAIRFPANDNFTVETAGSERLRINSSGKVIIGNDGTTFGNAAVQAFIAHGNTAGESGFSSVDTTSVAAGVGGEIAFHGKYNTGAQDWAYFGHIRGIKENATNGNTACALTFHTRPDATAPIERLRIDSDGRLLVGQTSSINGIFGSPPPRFSVSTTTASPAIFATYSNNTYASRVDLVKSRATSVGTHTVVQAGDALGEIYFGGSDGDQFHGGALIQSVVESGVGNDDMPADLRFSTNGGTTLVTERLRITSDGTKVFKNHGGGTIKVGGSSAHTSKIVIADNGGTANGNCLVEGGDGTDFFTIQSNGNVKFENGKGINFGATEGSGATASVLDDYEEGVFTPTLSGGTSQNNMYYTKIGRVVHICGSLAFNNISGSGNMVIGGLPYTSVNGLDAYTHLAAHAYDSLSVSNQTYQFQTMRVNQGSTNMMIIIPAGNGNVRTFAQYSHVSGSTFRFRVAGYYITA